MRTDLRYWHRVWLELHQEHLTATGARQQELLEALGYANRITNHLRRAGAK
jgi:hypothetical protein